MDPKLSPQSAAESSSWLEFCYHASVGNIAGVRKVTHTVLDVC